MNPREVAILLTPADWEAFKAAAKGAEAVLFKFSPRCPISFAAEDEYREWLAGLPEGGPLRIARVDVVAQRDLSRAIAGETGVGHQSPQVIWFGPDGAVRWHASHDQVNALRLSARR